MFERGRERGGGRRGAIWDTNLSLNLCQIFADSETGRLGLARAGSGTSLRTLFLVPAGGAARTLLLLVAAALMSLLLLRWASWPVLRARWFFVRGAFCLIMRTELVIKQRADEVGRE